MVSVGAKTGAQDVDAQGRRIDRHLPGDLERRHPNGSSSDTRRSRQGGGVQFPPPATGYPVRDGRTRGHARKEDDMDMDLWTYNEDLKQITDLSGFDVAAIDGDIGKVDEATYDVGSSYIVVDTGPWIFGKKVLIPASALETADLNDRKVFLRLTKDQIKESPELSDSDTMTDEDRDRVGSYYGSVYR